MPLLPRAAKFELPGSDATCHGKHADIGSIDHRERGIREDIGCRTREEGAVRLHQDHAARLQECVVRVVGGHDHRSALGGESADGPQTQHLVSHIEVRRGLIQQNDVGLLGQRS